MRLNKYLISINEKERVNSLGILYYMLAKNNEITVQEGNYLGYISLALPKSGINPDNYNEKFNELLGELAQKQYLDSINAISNYMEDFSITAKKQALLFAIEAILIDGVIDEQERELLYKLKDISGVSDEEYDMMWELSAIRFA
jgi:hypothetical protein